MATAGTTATFLFLVCASLTPQHIAIHVAVPSRQPFGALVGEGEEAIIDWDWRLAHEDRGVLDGPQDCDGCASTIDMRCLHAPHWRHAFYHRIVDCVIPLYGLINKIKEEKGTRCAITYFQDVDLEIFFSSIWSDLNIRLIGERAPCVPNMKYFAALPEKNGFRKSQNGNPNIRGEVSIIMHENVNALHGDVNRFIHRIQSGDVASEEKQKVTDFQLKRPLILVLRHNTRELTAESVKHLLQAASEETTTYTGAEPIATTLALWGTARGVMGYHGAGFANAAFITQDACVAEISIWMDKDSTRPWRTNARVATLNRNLNWTVYHLPLLQMLQVNGEDESLTAVDDYTIKNWPHVAVVKSDAKQIAGHMLRCQSRSQ